MRKYLIPTFILMAATAMAPHAGARSILSIRDSLQRVPVVYPESFETDVKAMHENWYLRNYADIDRDADSRQSVNATDQEIIDRLQAMPCVIEMPFNSVVRNYIDMYSQRRKQLVENMLGMSLYYMPIFEQALDRYGLPLELKYLPVIESALNPDAVSRAGATGLWQFMIPTATGEGLEVNSIVDQRRDPYASSDAAARYLKKLYGIYNDWSLAIASYNCGPGNVNKALRRAGIPADGRRDFWAIYPFLPAETRGYVPAFIAANYIMNYYDKHNISPALARKPIVTDTIHVSRRVHFDQISEVMGMPVEELRVLNPQYRKDIIPGNIRPYTLVLPSLQVYAYLANEDSIVNHNAAKYATRDIVEPADGSVKGSDSNGEYVEELVVKYHTVRRGETLATIARKYGVTQASIRQANRIGRKVKRGQRLKINTYRRRYIEPTPVETTAPVDANMTVQPADSTAVPATVTTPADTVQTATSAQDRRVNSAMSESSSRQQQSRAEQAEPVRDNRSVVTTPAAPARNSKRIHTVKPGDNLTKIAKKYGVSVNDIKTANNMSGDNLRPGQKLKIPSAGNSGKSSGRKKRSSRRR